MKKSTLTAIAAFVIVALCLLGINVLRKPETVLTREPAAEATVEPTAEPTVEPTAEPTEEPAAEATVEPTEEPAAEATEEPAAEATEEPTAEATEEPTPEPTEEPTPEPTAEPKAVAAAAPVAPVAPAAEEAAYVIPAGEVTKTAVADAYVGGMQIDASVTFDAQAAGEMSERMLALQSLMRKLRVTASFYDDFGTARIRAAVTLDGTSLFTVDAQLPEDGSAQAVTSLTGGRVLTLPAGTLSRDGKRISAYADESVATVDISDPAFAELPAFERLRITWEDILLLATDHVLGWTSYVQRETDGKLYAFDYTPIEATDTRDAVTDQMIGTINSWDFCELFYNILTTIRDERPEFQHALADSLAQLGVTRYQVRQFVDGLLTWEVMDPAVDWIQPSASVPDDGSLCEFGDVVYAVKKLHKSVDALLGDSGDDDLKLIVSYDHDGQMVGFDLDVPGISDIVPYEGSFGYSNKTDEHAQRLQTAHGEFQMLDGYRAEGDLVAHRGQDVDGVKASDMTGYLDLLHGEDGSVGVGVDASRSFRTDGGDAAEAFEASLGLTLREDGENADALTASLTGETSVEDGGFAIAAQANAALWGKTLSADIAVNAVEFDGAEFPAGEPLDLTAPGALETVKQTVIAQALALSMSLSGNHEIMQDVLALLGA